MKDRLWFSGAYRSWGVTNTAPIGLNIATDHHSLTLSPTENATDPGTIWDVTGRLTWQASSKDNLSTFLESQKPTRDRFRVSSVTTAEAAGINTFPAQTYQGRWTRVQSSNLLFDLAYQHYNMENQVVHVDEAMTQRLVLRQHHDAAHDAAGVLHHHRAVDRHPVQPLQQLPQRSHRRTITCSAR